MREKKKMIFIRNLSMLVMMFCFVVPVRAAAIKCVKLSASTECVPISAPPPYSIEWGADCNGVLIGGVGMCDTVAGKIGQQAPYLVASQGGTFCWCRMMLPVLSQWVFNRGFSSPDECAKNCVGMCAMATGNGLIRASLFSNLTE